MQTLRDIGTESKKCILSPKVKIWRERPEARGGKRQDNEGRGLYSRDGTLGIGTNLVGYAK